MNNIKTFESFTRNPMIKSIKRLFTGPIHKDVGKNVFKKIENFLKGQSAAEIELFQKPSRYNLSEYGDFKMSIGLIIDGEKFLVEVLKKPEWQLVINNVHYDASIWDCRNLWYLLDEYEKKNKYKVDKINKFFK